MTNTLPKIIVARHGQTEWAVTGQHTGRTDIPLTAAGEDEARSLGERIGKRSFAAVFTSPSQRARRTADLAGYGEAVVDDDLAEWDYGQYEGLLTTEIEARKPGWNIFTDGCPDGESAAQMTARAERVVNRLRDLNADALIFTSGHIARCIAPRWIGQPITLGVFLLISTASLSVLGYDHQRNEPAISKWNETGRD
ncbi:histidine phosphatase family protein [soil metagenome]